MSARAALRQLATSPQGRRVGAWVGLAVVCTLVSLAFAIRFDRAHPALSWSDEYVYLDAVDKASRGVVTRQFARIDELTMREASCRGIELYGPMGSPCGTAPDPALYDWQGGHTSADIHSPVYYFLTAWLSAPLRAVAPGLPLLSAARWTGALWLGLGLTALAALLRALGVGRLAVGATLALALASPSLRWASFYLTPDALSLLLGSGLVLLALRWWRGQGHWAWPVVVSAVAGLVKFQNVFAAVAVAAFLLLSGLALPPAERRRGLLRGLAGGVTLVAAGLATQFAYQAVRRQMALGALTPLDVQAPFSPRFAVSQLDNFLAYLYPGQGAQLPRQLVQQGPPDAVVALAGLAFVGATLAVALFRAPATDEARRLARAALLSIVGLGPLFYAYLALSMRIRFDQSPRYGLALLPLLLVSLPLVMTGRVRTLGLAAFAGLAVVWAWRLNALL